MNIRCSERKSERDPSYKEGQERATRKVRKGLHEESGIMERERRKFRRWKLQVQR